ncbi:hypothetical protein SFRURICE_008037 [Spodoptera frugiperda]|nr:hypothetical protein SFRURICE_008037 [Spodoptera frugiperda]
MGEAALRKLPNQMPDLGLESPIALFNYVNMTDSTLFTIYTIFVSADCPNWSSCRQCDCWTRGLEFDYRVGQSITGLFRNYENFSVVTRSLELCPAHPLLHGTYTTNGEKWVYIVGIAALHAVMCTSAYPFGNKKCNVAILVSN